MEMDVIMIRLDKYLSDMGIGTRAEVKKYIRQGRVKLDDQVIKTPEIKLDEKIQHVFFDGQAVTYEEYDYYMLHKPAGEPGMRGCKECSSETGTC